MLRNVFKMCDPVQWLRSQRTLSRRLKAAKKGVVGIVPAKELEHQLMLEELAERLGDVDHVNDHYWADEAIEAELPETDDTLAPIMGMRRASATGNGLFRHNRYERERSEHHHRPWWRKRTRFTPRRMEPTSIFETAFA